MPGLLGGEGVGGVDVCKQTVGNHLIVDCHVLDLIPYVGEECHRTGVSLHEGVLYGVVADGLRAVGQGLMLTNSLTVADSYDGHLIFSTHNLRELLSPTLSFHKCGPRAFGHFQDGLGMNTLKHAEVYLERLHERHADILQTVATSEGSLLYRLDTLRQIHRGEHLTPFKGRFANLFQAIRQRNGIQLLAPPEGGSSQFGDILWQHDCRQAETTRKHRVAHLRQSLAQLQRFYHLTIPEGRNADLLHRLRDDKLCQVDTTGEGIIADLLDTFFNREFLQFLTTLERPVLDNLHRTGNSHFLQTAAVEDRLTDIFYRGGNAHHFQFSATFKG